MPNKLCLQSEFVRRTHLLTRQPAAEAIILRSGCDFGRCTEVPEQDCSSQYAVRAVVTAPASRTRASVPSWLQTKLFSR